MKRIFIILVITISLIGCAKKQECRIDYDDVNLSVIYSVGSGSYQIEKFDDERKAEIFLKYLDGKYEVIK